MSERSSDPEDPLAAILAGRSGDEGSGDDDLQPRTRRQAREWAASREAAREEPKTGWFRRWGAGLIIVLVAVFIVGGGVAVWNSFQPQLAELFAASEPTDYDGTGEGAVTITIEKGDDGSDIAQTLADHDVVKSHQAFYSLLLTKRPEPVFDPGTYELRKHMSAASALDALMDPNSRTSQKLAVPEGMREADVLARASKVTGIAKDDLVEAAKRVDDYDVPKKAATLEGFLFPATYTFDESADAEDVIGRMVSRTDRELDDLGIAEKDRYRIVTLASIVQAEAGPNDDDLGKIARVFVNRIAEDMPLQSDATVKYDAGGFGSVWTTDEERQNEDNPYNTYVHHGLTPGPIGNPGRKALEAAASPTPGDWLYFVTVDLRTGETMFSDSYDQHKKAVKKMQKWCKDPDNSEYCD